MQPRARGIGRLRIGAVASLALALLSACGGDSEGGSAEASPVPDEMCEVGQVPQAAAYDLDDGSFRWASCADGNAYRSVRAVTDDAVYVRGTDLIALDPADGSVLVDAPDVPRSAVPPPGAIEVDGLTVSGGQDDPVSVRDTNGVLWTQPGNWAYDDVWAIDDDAVFAVERGAGGGGGGGLNSVRLVAYELGTGDIRWEYAGDPYAEGLWPWHAEDGRLFTVWNNLQVRDTGSGELLWKTSYPPSQISDLRMAGVDADDEAVYVGFASAPSGGD